MVNAPLNAPFTPNVSTFESNKKLALRNFGLHVLEQLSPLMNHLRELDLAKQKNILSLADLKWPYNTSIRDNHLAISSSKSKEVTSVDMTVALSYFDDVNNEVDTITSLENHFHRTQCRGDYAATLSVSSTEIEMSSYASYIFKGYGSIYIQVKSSFISIFDLRFSYEKIIYPLVIISTSSNCAEFKKLEGNSSADIIKAFDAYKEYEPFIRQVVEVYNRNYALKTDSESLRGGHQNGEVTENTCQLLTIF